MALQKALVSMVEQFTGFPVGDLIGAPLMAAAKANNAMALTQTRFILDTCFQEEENEDDVNYNAIGIQMDITRNNVTEASTSFNLPLLTILPLNTLAVDEVNVNSHVKARASNQ